MGMFQTVGSNERFGILEGARQKSVAAAGSSQTDAALIGANISIVSGATGSNGVVLRPVKGNTMYAAMVYSSAATNALLLYPPSGGTINGGTANASISITARKPAMIYSISPLNFIVLQGS